MAGWRDILHIVLPWHTGKRAETPSGAGIGGPLEYTVRSQQMHYTVGREQMHYTVKDNQMHYLARGQK